jgi:hypothetical protein
MRQESVILQSIETLTSGVEQARNIQSAFREDGKKTSETSTLRRIASKKKSKRKPAMQNPLLNDRF